MKYDAPSIAEFGRRAGFAPPALHIATAIALAGTNGIDNYELRTGIPGAGHYVGLYALNVDEWPEYTADELVVPSRAAEAAYELTRRLDGFGWSAVWRAGHERPHLNVAAEGSSRLPWGETQHVPIGLHVVQRKIDAMGRRMQTRYARGRNL